MDNYKKIRRSSYEKKLSKPYAEKYNQQDEENMVERNVNDTYCQ